MNFNKKIIPLVLVTTVSQSCISTAAVAQNRLDPQAASYGYYVDNWAKNSTSNMTPDGNPSIGVLSEFLKVFTSGTSWNNGTILNQDIHDHNINTVIEMTSDNTTSAAVVIDSTTGAAAEIDMTKFTTGPLSQVYFDDRRDQNYSITDGLGKYTDVFRTLANAGTTITDVLEDSTTVLYTDKGNSNGVWADVDSELGSMVKLINTMRNSAASTTPAKNYYQYMRPFRWSSDVKLLPTLISAKKSDDKASSDGGFPSGHTNAAYVSSIGLAYAVPERFQEILTRASELGNDRIESGYHSPLDVMGGRTMATAVAAAALYNESNATVKADAYNEAHTKLLTQGGTSEDRFSDYKKNKQDYIERLTYGFEQSGEKGKPMVVPKGAEVLLETRLPYLDANQRRDVLYTTGLESGYPVLDDAEGWGRLNLFSAADGYGAFNDNVTVNMDAAKGGFNALDSWRNDISGSGALIKEGTGTLKLEGDNTYSGGTQINQGTLEADSDTSLGTGSVTNDGGILIENVSGIVNVDNEYKQSENSTLELSIGSKDDVFQINGNANFSGKLKLDFSNGYIPKNNMAIITFKGNTSNSKFSSIETEGLSSKYKVNIFYEKNSIRLSLKKSSGSNDDSSSSSASSATDNVNSNSTTNANKNEAKAGWQQKDGAWYNLSGDGKVNTGWFKDTGEKWYYLDKLGVMQRGWFKDIDEKWYYLDKSGVMERGWFRHTDGNWYYLNQNGVMQTGWFKDIDGNWYYLNQNGAMEHDKYIDGYYLDTNGVWVQ